MQVDATKVQVDATKVQVNATKVQVDVSKVQVDASAAHNMTGKAVKFRGLPFFWTMQFKFSLRYIGHAQSWDEMIIDGDLQKQQFVAFYIKNNQVLAATTSHQDTEAVAISELMRLNQMPTVEELQRGAVDLIHKQPQVSSKG